MQKFREIIIDLFDEGAGAASTATGGNDSGSNTDSAKNTNAVRSDIAKKGRDLRRGLSQKKRIRNEKKKATVTDRLTQSLLCVCKYSITRFFGIFLTKRKTHSGN